jgi:transposase
VKRSQGAIVRDDVTERCARLTGHGRFVRLSRTIRAHRERHPRPVELGLSNLKLEGLNSKIRLINHRGYGHHSPAALISMIYLCCGGITVDLPTGR